MIEFTVPGIPVAQPRQRHRVVQGHGRIFAQNYMPRRDPVNAFKAAVQLAGSRANKYGRLFSGPLMLKIFFVLPRPVAMHWKTKPMDRIWHDKKPDVENLAKAVMDGLTGTLWNDDRQVAMLLVRKVIAHGTEPPHTVITIQELEGCPA